MNCCKVATLISAALLAACGTAGSTAGVVHRGQAFDLNTVAMGREWIVSMAGAQPEWHATRGVQAVRMAVVDSGIDGTHPDLLGRLVSGIDLVDGDGHGTHVAGIIGATADDGLGISGVAPGAMLMPVRVMDEQGEGTVARVCEGIIKAADMGADVLNLSIGSREGALAKQAAIDHALAKGTVVVAAMGNSGSFLALYPAANRGVIAVGATRQGDVLADYANYGVWMAIVAPGTGILSTLPRGRWWPLSGTSTAAPHVSGVAALVRSLRPGLSPPAAAALLQGRGGGPGAAGAAGARRTTWGRTIERRGHPCRTGQRDGRGSTVACHPTGWRTGAS